ncbi:MAG: ABC transporter ATP-binding protein [Spirochaetaceae bacterium]|nr:MAG: ABC transporter ATP-binding protein [Spirochaetaceae bacterium]
MSDADENALVRVEQLDKHYQTGGEKLSILQSISLSIWPGQTVSIAGTSGCGKSTLLNMISGLDSPSNGRVVVGDLDVSSLDERAAGYFRNQVLGMVFQAHHLLKEFTLLENTAMPALIAGSNVKQAQARAKELLEMVGVGNRASHFPGAVSGGERQRAAVARALMNNPRLILADEPTGNLDEQHSDGVQQLLFDVVAQTGAALVLVTHDKDFAARAQRPYLLQHGRLEEA